MIRVAWAYTTMVAATLYSGGRAVLYYFLLPRYFRKRADQLTGEWTSICMKGAGARLVVRHGDRLCPGRGQILVANHQSWFDIFALGTALRHKFSFVGKQELNRIPVVGAAWQKVGNIAIDRTDQQAAIDSLRRVDELLEEGRTIIMFPEGTRSPTGEMGRFKKGAFVMAIKSQVPVVPVAIQGTRGIMKKGSWVISRGTATVTVGNPISTEGLTLRDRNPLSRKCRDAITSLLNGEGEDPCRPS